MTGTSRLGRLLSAGAAALFAAGLLASLAAGPCPVMGRAFVKGS